MSLRNEISCYEKPRGPETITINPSGEERRKNNDRMKRKIL